jgi:hypothetical protein
MEQIKSIYERKDEIDVALKTLRQEKKDLDKSIKEMLKESAFSQPSALEPEFGPPPKLKRSKTVKVAGMERKKKVKEVAN